MVTIHFSLLYSNGETSLFSNWILFLLFLRPFEKFPTLPIGTFEGGDGGIGGAEWEGWARNQLMAAGSDLLGKFSNLQVLD